MKFYDKDKRKNDLQTLAYALSKRDTTPINVNGIAPVQTKPQSGLDVASGAGDLLSGGMKFYNGLKNSGLFDKGQGIMSGEAELGGWLPKDTMIGGNYFGSGSSGSMVFDNIMGNGGSGSMTMDNLGSSGSGVPALGYLGVAKGLMNGLNQGFNSDDKILGGFGNGAQGFLGIDSKNDSDVSQSLKGAANGAVMGLPFGGPIGAAVGAILGLGSSFLDDF